jgi:esterase
MADAVMAWMEAINLPKAHFLGHSLGGKVSMELALRDPSRVDKLVIADIAPVAYERRHDEVFGGFRAVDLDRIASRSDAEQAMAPLVALESTRSFLLKNLEKINNKWRWRIHLDVLERDYHHLIAANSAHLPPFARPTLFMKGEKSNYILPEHREHTLTLFPEASIKIIDNTEHWLHAEKPDIFAGIVKRFLVR